MVFWDVDTQVDFLLPGGRLYVPGAEEIIPNLVALTDWARSNRMPVISSVCAHEVGDPELETYGPHCMVGSTGQQKIPEMLLPDRLVVPNRPIALPELRDFQQVIIEKQEFDVFTNPNTDSVVKQVGTRLDILLYGVVTEICVAAAAMKLVERGHKVTLVADAIRELDAAKAAKFRSEFLSRGGELRQTNEIIGRRP